MEVKLENLIEKIREEGVERAKVTSQEIIERANEEAAEIVTQTKKEAAMIIEQTKREADKIKRNADGALAQASRDLLLVLREKIEGLFNQALKIEIAVQLKEPFLKELILKTIESWGRGKDVELLMSQRSKKGLEGVCVGRLKKMLKEGVTIRVDDRIEAGFRIGIKGENLHYDFTDEGIFETLKVFLSPKLIEIIDKDNG